jgi:predicted permease
MKPWTKFAAFFRKGKLDAEMAEEMRAHLELQTRENMRRGMAPDEARYAAQREFGGVEQIKEQARDQRGGRWLDQVRQDVRFSHRMMFRHPGFALAAILTFGLGIGFVTTVFTIINGIMLRPLPLPEGDRIMTVGLTTDHFPAARSQQTSFTHLALMDTRPVNLGLEGAANRQPAARVSADFLAMLQIQPAFGRTFFPAEYQPGRTTVALISDRLWREELGGAREVIGRVVRINGEPHTVIGVMPAGFAFPRSESLWRPLPDEPDAANNAEVLGRLRAGATPQQAATELTTIVRRLQPTKAGAAAPTVTVESFAGRHIKGAVRNVLLAILAATGLVLALACANVANLFLARASERSRELAVRAAVGATRSRLVVQLMTETCVLSVLGAAVGGWIAFAATQLSWRYIQGEQELTGGAPYWMNFQMDWRVFAFVAAATVLAAVLSGLAPALRASRADVNERLKAGGGGAMRLSRFSRVLVNVQMAGSVALVTTAGLFVTVFFAAQRKTLPYAPASVLTARLDLDPATYPTPERQAVLQERVMDAVRAQPGVEAVAFTTATSLRLSQRRIQLENESYARNEDAPWCGGESVTDDFFAALGTRLLAGRFFAHSDHADAPLVAVVTPAFVARFGGGQDVIGRRFRFGRNGPNARWITIVGVVSDPGSVKAGQEGDGARFYQPLRQNPAAAVTLVVRARGSAAALGETVRQAVLAADPDLPISKLLTSHRILELERIGINLPAVLFAVCGVAALLLATVGVYGVISLSVRNRTREFGVRLALGADPRAIVRLVLRDGVRDLALGLGAGLLLALGASAGVRSAFVGFIDRGGSGWIYLAVAGLLGGVGGLALFVPARRAAKVDPMVALRAE